MCTRPTDAYLPPHGGSPVLILRDGQSDYLPIVLPCGRCMECRLRRSREWMVRLYAESLYHQEAISFTLTYDEENLPPHLSLRMDDTSAFIKRLRTRLSGRKIKFFCAGEYSPKKKRPHYHGLLYGYAALDSRQPAGQSETGHALYTDQLLTDSWSHGIVKIGSLTPESAQYCAKYTIEKVYGKAAEDHYGKRESERMRCSKSMGAQYLYDNLSAIKARNWTVVLPSGAEAPIPRYYIKLLEKTHPELALSALEHQEQKIFDSLNSTRQSDRTSFKERFDRNENLKAAIQLFKKEQF